MEQRNVMLSVEDGLSALGHKKDQFFLRLYDALKTTRSGEKQKGNSEGTCIMAMVGKFLTCV
jgi:hypothetical protein